MRPMALGQHGLGGHGIALLDIADDALAVDGVRDGLPNLFLRQQRVLQVEGQVLIDRAG